MKFETGPAPHIRGADSVPALMLKVLVALVPATLLHVWFFGIGIILNMIAATVFALASEAVMLRIRRQPMSFYLTDYSAAVTAVLLAFALPPLTPFWITGLGAIFAIVVAKHIYGGLGYNLFNPAMAGYVMLLVAFPDALARWSLPPMGGMDEQSVGLLGTIGYFFTGSLPDGLSWDQVSGATPLDAVQTQLGQMQTMQEIMVSPIFGSLGGTGWEWVNLAIVAGGIWMLSQRIIQWHIPAGVIGGLLVASMLFYIIDSDVNPSPLFEVMTGGALLGAFFVATDPVSAASSNRGKLIYGAGIGLLTFLIRRWGSYPDGVAFAVLLMNMAVPLIDRYTQPRIYGHQ